MHESWASLAAAGGHLLYALLGLVVLVLAPRSTPNRAFALYSIGSGLAGAFGRVAHGTAVPPELENAIEGILWASAAVGVVALARAFPTPLQDPDRRSIHVCVVLAVALCGILAISWVAEFGARPLWVLLSFGILMATSSASTVLFALRSIRSPAHLPSYGVMSIAVFAPIALYTGSAISATVGPFAWWPLFAVLCVLSVAAVWIRTMLRAPAKRWAIAVCWAAVGATLAAQAAAALDASGAAYEFTVAGVRLLAVVPLAFLIVRGQVPGLETRVRWTVSRGTVAAVFVAVFFVVSEAAQQLLGDTTGSAYLGIAAAGALVFVIAPLQRAAERLAEKAVPVPGANDPRSTMELPYRKAVRLALRDRGLTRDEELRLHDLARDLGLDGVRAHAIIAEVEKEVLP